MNKGYIKLWRKSKDSMVFNHEGIWKLFCLCLMLANHKEKEVMLPGILKAIKLKPGQFITGRDSLHYAYHQGHIKKKYSPKSRPTAITLYRWLLFLQNHQILNIKSYSKYSIITITNWYLYQENEQQTNNRRTTGEHKQECIKNEKEIYGEVCRQVITFLNETSGRKYTSSNGNCKYISARCKEGFTLEDFKKVILTKWKDPDFNKKFYRPSTLFNSEKFEGYLNENQQKAFDEI